MIVCLGTTPTVQRTMSFASLTIDGVNRAKSIHQFASGKSINAARVLKTIGEDVIALGPVGGDSGNFIRQDLARAGIAHDLLEAAAPTRLCLTLLDESAGTATELIEESSTVPPAAADELLAKLRSKIDATTVLMLSGR